MGNTFEKLDRRSSVSSLKSFQHFKQSNEKLHSHIDKVFNDVPKIKLPDKYMNGESGDTEDLLAAINEHGSENEQS